MHLPEQWTEFQQLCDSKPFQMFCESPLPTPDQRVICRACGNQVDESGHGHQELASRTSSSPGWVDIPPEERWEMEGRPAWTAPYVWQTRY